MAKLIWVYVLDTAGVTGLTDANGVPVGTPQKGMVYAALDSNAEIAADGSKKLYHAVNGIIDPSKLEEVLKAYHQPPTVVKPAKPGTLTESGVTKTEIKLDWDQVADAANYNIAVTPAVAGYPKDISVNTLTLTGLTAATAYTIKVKACNSAGCSAQTQKTVTTAT